MIVFLRIYHNLLSEMPVKLQEWMDSVWCLKN